MPRGVRGTASGVGKRRQMRATGEQLAQAFPDKMRERLEPLLDVWFQEYEYDLTTRVLDVGPHGQNNPSHRTALDLYPRMMRLIGVSDEAVNRLLDTLGARDRDDLERTYARGKLAEGSDLEQACERAKDLLRRRMASEHDYRRRLLWELFGMREAVALDATRTDVARPATNGHGYGSEVTNGNGSRS